MNYLHFTVFYTLLIGALSLPNNWDTNLIEDVPKIVARPLKKQEIDSIWRPIQQRPYVPLNNIDAPASTAAPIAPYWPEVTYEQFKNTLQTANSLEAGIAKDSLAWRPVPYEDSWQPSTQTAPAERPNWWQQASAQEGDEEEEQTAIYGKPGVEIEEVEENNYGRPTPISPSQPQWWPTYNTPTPPIAINKPWLGKPYNWWSMQHQEQNAVANAGTQTDSDTASENEPKPAAAGHNWHQQHQHHAWPLIHKYAKLQIEVKFTN